jgi:hypothetical protein
MINFNDKIFNLIIKQIYFFKIILFLKSFDIYLLYLNNYFLDKNKSN